MPQWKRDEGLDGVARGFAKRTAEDQVFRRVAGHREFRQGDKVAGVVTGADDRLANPLDVAGDVADGGVDLTQANPDGPHGDSVVEV